MQGWCNNVAWNVGPLTRFQYKVAVDRHTYYKLHRFHSIIPMIQLSWNLARNCRGVMSNASLLSLLREFLGQSLSACSASLECAAEFGKEVKWHGREDGEPAHYCENCEVCRCSLCICIVWVCAPAPAKLAILLICYCLFLTRFAARYGDSVYNTAENSSVFSLIRMRWSPSARACGQ